MAVELAGCNKGGTESREAAEPDWPLLGGMTGDYLGT